MKYCFLSRQIFALQAQCCWDFRLISLTCQSWKSVIISCWHTLTLAAATVTTGQPVIEVSMCKNSPEPRPQNELFGMQTDTLYSNWGITLWSSAPNPCFSWSRLRRNVILIATKWLGIFLFFYISKLYSVSRTDKLSILITLWLTPFLPLVKFWSCYCCVDTTTIVVSVSISFSAYLCISFLLSPLKAVVPLMAARQRLCKSIL